nr:hypothetical protein [Pseudoalteromonas sp. OANN1]
MASDGGNTDIFGVRVAICWRYSPYFCQKR